jgi:hypothetical protein
MAASGGPFYIRGGSLWSDNTKAGTAGTLWSAGNLASGTQTLQNNQILKLSYELTLTSG